MTVVSRLAPVARCEYANGGGANTVFTVSICPHVLATNLWPRTDLYRGSSPVRSSAKGDSTAILGRFCRGVGRLYDSRVMFDKQSDLDCSIV